MMPDLDFTPTVMAGRAKYAISDCLVIVVITNPNKQAEDNVNI